MTITSALINSRGYWLSVRAIEKLIETFSNFELPSLVFHHDFVVFALAVFVQSVVHRRADEVFVVRKQVFSDFAVDHVVEGLRVIFVCFLGKKWKSLRILRCTSVCLTDLCGLFRGCNSSNCLPRSRTHVF